MLNGMPLPWQEDLRELTVGADGGADDGQDDVIPDSYLFPLLACKYEHRSIPFSDPQMGSPRYSFVDTSNYTSGRETTVS